jgi:hypothetical protein
LKREKVRTATRKITSVPIARIFQIGFLCGGRGWRRYWSSAMGTSFVCGYYRTIHGKGKAGSGGGIIYSSLPTGRNSVMLIHSL